MDDSDSSSKNRKWTDAETTRLCYLAKKYNKNWRIIARFFPGRTSKLCQMRWMISNPSINQSSLTIEEMDKLYDLVEIHGNKWKYLTSFSYR